LFPCAIRELLIRRVDNLGDILIALPAFRALREAFPRARVTAMVRPAHKVLLHGLADRFLEPIPLQSLRRVRSQYDLMINIEYSYPKGYRPTMAGTRRMLHVGIPDWDRCQHVSKGLLDGLRAHGIRCTYRPPRLKLAADVLSVVEEFRRTEGLSFEDDFVVAVNPGSKFKHKRWPVDRYVEICRWLISRYQARIVVVSQNRSDFAARTLYNRLPRRNRTWLANQSLDSVAAILSHCSICIGNDSGIAHLASVVGVPTVTVFGPTSPRLWKPAGGKAIMLQSRHACEECGYEGAERCRDKKCLTDITTEEFADGIIYCISRHLRRESHPRLDRISVARHLDIVSTKAGTVLRNREIQRPLLVRVGLPQVLGVLKLVEGSHSYSQVIRRAPQHRQLLDMLARHRIVV